MTATPPPPFSPPELPSAEARPRADAAEPGGGAPQRRRRREAPRRARGGPRLARAADHALRWGPPALLLFAPLAWGSVEPWAEAVLLSGSGFLGCLGLLRLAADPEAAAAERAVTSRPLSWSGGLHAPLAALALLAAVQALPLGAVVGAVSPVSAELYRLAGGATARLSVAPAETVRAAAEVAALALLFLALLGSLRARGEVRALGAVLLALGFAHALGGILWHFSGGWRAYGLAERVGTSFGPYVNRNHFANLMAMTIPVGVGVLLSLPHRRPRTREAGPGAAVPARDPEVGPRQVLAGFAVAVMAGALALSLSRGGIASACLALGALALAAGYAPATRGRLARLAAAAAAAAGFAVWIGGGALLERLATFADPLGQSSFTARASIWRDTLRLAADYPLFGSGFGSFASAFPRYQSGHPDGAVLHAHGDWLQLLAEGGLAGAVAALLVVGTFLAALARVVARRRDAEAVFLALGGLGGLVAFLAHGTAEFSLHVPANALWFTVLAAWTLKAAASRRG